MQITVSLPSPLSCETVSPQKHFSQTEEESKFKSQSHIRRRLLSDGHFTNGTKRGMDVAIHVQGL